ncbi:MAG TPA: chemotaxis protein CheW [Gemmatimonadaceae bacterium]|nr:chemotaxis protein CheW [Gemmatimonadaceae bacterium]
MSSASTVSTPDTTTGQLLIFRLADRRYGVSLDTVREILPFRRPTRLPGGGAQVAGLVNVRGTIVTVLDLGARLGERAAARAGGSIVLVEHGGKVVGVAVDEVLDVLRVADVEIETDAAELIPGGTVRALGRLDGEVVGILDIQDIITQVLA